MFDALPAAAAALAARGARLVALPREAAERADVVFIRLPGPVEVEQAALGPDGIVHGVRPGCVYVDLSSGSPTVIRKASGRTRRSRSALGTSLLVDKQAIKLDATHRMHGAGCVSDEVYELGMRLPRPSVVGLPPDFR